MNKFLSVLVGLTLVLSGVNFFQLNSLKLEVKGSFGVAPIHNTQEEFSAGLKAGRTNQFTISNAGVVSSSAAITTTGALTGLSLSLSDTANSSSSPAALGAAVTGHMIIASAATTGNASSTAVTADSKIFLQQEFTSPIAGTTCKATSATTTPAVATKVVGNGFTVSLGAAVTGNTCLAFWILP